MVGEAEAMSRRLVRICNLSYFGTGVGSWVFAWVWWGLRYIIFCPDNANLQADARPEGGLEIIHKAIAEKIDGETKTQCRGFQCL